MAVAGVVEVAVALAVAEAVAVAMAVTVVAVAVAVVAVAGGVGWWWRWRWGSTRLLQLVLGLLCRDLAIELAHRSLDGLGLGRLSRLLRVVAAGLGLLGLRLTLLGLGEVDLLHLRELRRNTGPARRSEGAWCAVRSSRSLPTKGHG